MKRGTFPCDKVPQFNWMNYDYKYFPKNMTLTLFFHLLFHYYHNTFNIFTLILLKYLYTLLKEYLLLMNILQKWCLVRHVKTRPLTSKIIFIFNFLSDIELYEEICQHIAGFLRLIINFSLTPFSYCPSFMLNPLLL